MLDLLSQPSTWVSLLTLTALEIVLGIDNIVFVAILADKLPAPQRQKVRQLGLLLALATRLLLLFSISWLMGLTTPWFTVLSKSLSGRDCILLLGGVFLIGKATHEIFDKLEGEPEQAHVPAPAKSPFASVLIQIAILDVVFSLDSVITAVGMAKHLVIMAAAVILAVIAMLIFAGAVSRFIERHPSMKILALSFLILVGVVLTSEAFGQRINKGYIYFAMAFSLLVELVNIRMRQARDPVRLRR